MASTRRPHRKAHKGKKTSRKRAPSRKHKKATRKRAPSRKHRKTSRKRAPSRKHTAPRKKHTAPRKHHHNGVPRSRVDAEIYWDTDSSSRDAYGVCAAEGEFDCIRDPNCVWRSASRTCAAKPYVRSGDEIYPGPMLQAGGSYPSAQAPMTAEQLEAVAKRPLEQVTA